MGLNVLPHWYRRRDDGQGLLGAHPVEADQLAQHFTAPVRAVTWLRSAPPLGSHAAHALIQGPGAETMARRIVGAAGERVEVFKGGVPGSLAALARLLRQPGGPLVVVSRWSAFELLRIAAPLRQARRRAIFAQLDGYPFTSAPTGYLTLLTLR